MDNNMDDNMDMNMYNVEHWKIFLEPIFVKDLSGDIYRCNNKIYLVNCDDKFKKLYRDKNSSELIEYVTRSLDELQINLSEKRYFFKLSTVSPKDIIKDEFTNDYQSIDEYVEYVNNLTKEDIIKYWQISNSACQKNMIVKSPRQIVEMLLASNRINEYLEDSEYLVFREWIDYSIEEEFRCFIYNGQLVAISQYDYFLPLPYQPSVELIPLFFEQSAWVSDSLNAPQRALKDLIPYKNAVMDLAIHNGKIYFIEFNAFGNLSDTDAGLFDWVKDEDILTPIYFDKKVNIRLFEIDHVVKKFEL